MVVGAAVVGGATEVTTGAVVVDSTELVVAGGRLEVVVETPSAVQATRAMTVRDQSTPHPSQVMSSFRQP